MNKLNKKGFTLVELMAVLVILITIMVIALLTVSKLTERSKLNSFIEEAHVFTKAAKNKYYADRTNEDSLTEDLLHNKVDGYSCYSISDQLLGNYVSKDEKQKYSGSVLLCHGDSCAFDSKIWLTNGEYYINGLTDTEIKDDISKIQYSQNASNFNSCNYDIIGGGTDGTATVAEFKYTGKTHKMTIIKDGTYKLEAWGAQGGNMNPRSGGYGAYSYVEVSLNKGDILYVNVGGQGASNCANNTCTGGFNGGGDGSSTVAAGGGASSVTLDDGTLNKVRRTSNILVVAGGGGGASLSGNGYSGGGNCSQDGGVCQSGRLGLATNSCGGGYRAGTSIVNNLGRGGSGYVGNTSTLSGYMYCYGCENTSNTYSTSSISLNPIANSAKQGDGYVKISYLDDTSIVTQGVLATDFSNYLRLEYLSTTGSQYFDTEYMMKPNSGVHIRFRNINRYNPGYVIGASSSNALIGLSTAIYTEGWNGCGGNNFNYVFNDGAASSVGTGIQSGCINAVRDIKINMNSESLNIDNAYRHTRETAPVNNATRSLYISANNNNGTVENYNAIDIYDLEIYENNTLVRHYIPCSRKTDGAAGLCELYTKKFFTSKGSGSVIKGPVNNT